MEAKKKCIGLPIYSIGEFFSALLGMNSFLKGKVCCVCKVNPATAVHFGITKEAICDSDECLHEMNERLAQALGVSEETKQIPN